MRRLPSVYEGRAEDSYRKARLYEICQRDEAVCHCALFYLEACDTMMNLAFETAAKQDDRTLG